MNHNANGWIERRTLLATAADPGLETRLPWQELAGVQA